MRTRSVLTTVVILATSLALTGCAGASGASDLKPIAAPSATPSPSATPAPAAPDCGNPVASYAPNGPTPSADALPAGSTMAAIKARGSLIVGVAADNLFVGARNPIDGQIEGFDIDMLHQISTAIFGSPDHLQFKVITDAQRLGVLQNHEVDIVARAMTINCSRWASIAFSTEYYHAGQKVIVPLDSTATSITDLNGKKVCAPAGTTTIANLKDYPKIRPVSASTISDCLVLFQQGKVDAITSDDTILAGLAVQDPYAKVIGPAFTNEPYGLGMPADKVDLVRFVNGVLDQMRSNGTWTNIYNKWFTALGPAPAPPAAVYGRG